ncbi:MAG TPA: SRPBCC family protein [Kofleriaceae bacterium]|nr:SRPBCC family protein [Kofleriaceae bacterium]
MATPPTTGTVTIRRAADEVFDYLRTYDNEAAWEDFVLEARSDPPGPATVGTRVHKVRRTPVGQERFTIEVIEMDVDQRRWVDVAIDGYLKDTRIQWQVTPVEGGSRVDVSIDLHGHGLLKGIMPVVRRTARHQLRTELESLRRVLEAGPAAHPAAS